MPLQKASKSTKELSDNQKAATSSADALASAVKRLAASYLSIQGLKRAVDLSDSLVSTRARLDRMNDGLQTTQQLETMIYQSAQRSRGNFMDTIGGWFHSWVLWRAAHLTTRRRSCSLQNS